MSSLEKKWEDLDITKDEVISITEALKNEDFRKLLVEYVKDTQSPESRKKYQDDIVQLEAERGVLCSFVNPVPGFVIKTSIDGVKKAFINVCSNPLVGKPVSKPMTTENSRGLSWSIPYSQDPGRDDYDKKNNRCIVYDVIFHPDTLHLAQNNKQFKDMVINTALKGVENTFSVKLDHRNIKLPKLKYKGVPNPSVIRRKSKTPVNLAEEDLEFHKKFEYPTSVPETPRAPTVTTFGDEEVKEYTTPHYLVKHRTDIDVQEFTENRHAKMNAAIPKELVIEIHLPLLKSTKDVNLDILEKSLELVCEKPARYKLNLELPYAVSQNGNAKFDTDKRILVVTLPVLRRSQNCSDYIREDSGVESDNGEHVVPENNSENPDEVKNSENIKETFLDVDQHYVLPSFDCNRENNSICFILNVKNVDPSSIKTKNLDRGFLIKFTSVGSGYFPIHYAFCAKFDSDLAEDIGVEAWDNNVTVQVQMSYLGSKGSILVGLNEEELEEKRLQDITDLTGSAEGEKEEERRENDISVVSVAEEEVVFDVDMGGRESSPEDISDEASQHIPELPSKMRTYSEGSGDEVSGGPRRSILKNRMNRSLSESCADEAGAGFAGGVLYTWSDSCISDGGDGDAKEVKKTVRFSQHIQRQTFRANSSILGQRRKNQKRTRNKKKAMERRLSESENSEEGDEREKWTKRRPSKNCEAIQSVIAEEDTDTKEEKKTELEKKKKKKPKSIEFQSQLVHELDD